MSLRYFTVFGPRQRPDMAFHIFCRAALEGRPVNVFGDGRQTRDFTYVSDVVAATAAAGEAALDDDRAFNIGGGTPTSVRAGAGPDLRAGRRLARGGLPLPEDGDVKDTGADTSRARAQLGFAPETSLEEGLSAEFEWMKELVELERSAG